MALLEKNILVNNNKIVYCNVSPLCSSMGLSMMSQECDKFDSVNSIQLIIFLVSIVKHKIYLNVIIKTYFQRTKRSDLGEVVILDADNNTIETPFQDLDSLPSDVVCLSFVCATKIAS